jgi:hypothetical protein
VARYVYFTKRSFTSNVNSGCPWQKNWALSRRQCLVSSSSFNQLEEDGVMYAITADQDRAVKWAIALIPSGDWKEPVKGCGRELVETVHCMN